MTKSKKLANRRQVVFFFIVCFLAYYSTYLGRLNYAASLAEIIRKEGFSKGQAGLVGTAFFFSYGAGQLVSGFAGDRGNSKWLVFVGLMGTAVMNAVMGCLRAPEAMTVVWCLNGVAQSMVWSPMLHIICELLDAKTRMKFCMYINYSVPLGTFSSYGLSALLIGIRGWRTAFLVPAVLVGATALFWFFGMKSLGYSGKKEFQSAERFSGQVVEERRKIFLFPDFLFLLLAVCVQGALKDGVTVWIPVYLEENHSIGSIVAILSTMAIPFFNLMGVALACFWVKKMGENEILSASVFYEVGALALGALFIGGSHNVIFALCMLATVTTSMMSVNALLIAILPSRFGQLGKASIVSGILNSCVYAGCALSTYGIGKLTESRGWDVTIFLWMIGAVAAGGICIGCCRRWKWYVNEYLAGKEFRIAGDKEGE